MAEVKGAHFKEMYQSADWKKEKHVPVIEAPDEVTKGEFFDV
jgi:superoxide reductase